MKRLAGLRAGLLLAAGSALAQPPAVNPDICDGDGRAGEAKEFLVYPKGGPAFAGRSWLCRDPLGNSPAMRLKIDGRTIYPYHTDSIFEDGIKATPAPGSTSWAFPIIEGRVRVFAARPGRKFQDAIALSKDGEALVRYNLKTLEDRVKEDPESGGLVQHRRSARLYSGTMAVAGVAMGFIGFVTSMEEVPDEGGSFSGDTKMEFRPNPLFFAGVGLVVASWFLPQALTEQNPEQALRQYNLRHAADSSRGVP